MSDLRIVKGNTFSTEIQIKAYTYYDGREVEDFNLLACTNVAVSAKVNGAGAIMDHFSFVIEPDNKIYMTWDSSDQQLGSYTLEVTGTFEGTDWRYYSDTPIFDIVYSNEEALIPKSCMMSRDGIILEDVYRLEAEELYMAAAKGDKGDPGEKGDKGDPGEKGDNGDTPIALYKWSQTEITTAPTVTTEQWNTGTPASLSGWKKASYANPYESNGLLYVSQNTLTSGTTIDSAAWNTPCRLNGDDGAPGVDGNEREWIYIGDTEYRQPYADSTHQHPKNISRGQVHGQGTWIPKADQYTTDNYVPEGWSDNAIAIDDTTNKYVYVSWRDKTAGSTWGDFQDPAVLSNWGERGTDGDGVEYVFIRTNSDTAPTITDSTSDYDNKHWYDDDYLPLSSAGRCTDDPVGTDDTHKFEWVAKRTKPLNADGKTRTWEKYSGTMALWANYGEQGERGPGQPSYIQTQEAWSSVESVSDPTTEPVPNGGWSDTTPANPNNYAYLWRRTRKMVLNVNGTYDVASGGEGEWKYQRLSGTNGTSITTKGTIVAAAAGSVSLPTTDVATGALGIKQGDATMWTFNGTTWVETQTESSDGDSYTVTKHCVVDLEQDNSAIDIINHLIMWSAEATKWIDLGQFKGDSGSTYYTHIAWASGVTLADSLHPVPSHTPSQGQISVPNGYIVTTFHTAPFDGATHMGTLIDTTSTDSSEKYCYTWQEVKGEQGPKGGNTATIYLYKRSASTVSIVGISSTLYYQFSTKGLYTSSACTTPATTELNGWSLTIPNDSTDPIYVTTAIAYSNRSIDSSMDVDDIGSNEWVTPAQMAESGESINSAAVFLYKRASSTPDDTNGNYKCPQSTLYYRFADGNLYTSSSFAQQVTYPINGWYKEIPPYENNKPCYIIQAAALSTDEYDAIEVTKSGGTYSKRDWSDPKKYFADGETGNGISNVSRTYAISAYGINYNGTDDTSAGPDTNPPHDLYPYSSSQWSANSPATTDIKPFLWAREVVEFTDSSMNTVKYYCVGAKGDSGVDAQDVEWVYIRTKTNIAPVIDSDNTYTDSNNNTYISDDHLPKVVPGTGGSASDIEDDNSGNVSKPYECTDDPKGVNDEYKYEWEIKRTKGAAVNGRRSWNYYSGPMTLHNNFAEGAFIIDTDNDNDQFGTDSNSMVLVSQTRSTTVTVYDGAATQTLNSLSVALKYEDDTNVANSVATYTVNTSTGVVSVTILQNTTTAFSHEAIKAIITASVTGKGTKSTVFTIRKVMSGLPGLSPTIYQLNPTNKSFVFNRNASNSLTPSKRSTVVNALKTYENTTQAATSADNLTFTWGFDESSTAQGSGAIGNSSTNKIDVSNTQANSHYQVWIQLSSGDRETLPIIKDGAVGDDAVNVIVTPNSMLIEQDINNKDNIQAGPSNNLGQFSIQVLRGDTPRTIMRISAVTEHVYISESSSTGYYTGTDEHPYTWNPDTDTANMYVKGIIKNGSVYYSTGQIKLSITYADPDISSAKTISNVVANVYVNLVGTWKETIEGDVKTEIAAATTYYVEGDPTAYRVSSDLGTFIKSSTENTSLIDKKIDNGKNIFTGSMTGLGWTKHMGSTTWSSVTLDSNGWFEANPTYKAIKSPTITLEAGYKVTLSFAATASGTVGAKFTPSGSTAETLTPTYDSTTQRYYITYPTSGNISTTTNYTIGFSNVLKIYHPQIEYGVHATVFEANTSEQESMIRQTADEISLEVSGLSGDVSNLSGDVSELSDKVTATNLLPCLDWQDGHALPIDTDVEKCYISSTDDVIESPLIYLTAGTYSFSFYIDSYDWDHGNIEAYYATGSSGSGGGQFYNLVSDSTDVYNNYIRVYGTFTLPTENYVSFSISTIDGSSVAIYRPQVEKGNTHTAYVPCGDPVGSTGYVNVKANEVNVGIRNDLGTTGINITSGTINLKGNKVTFSNTAGTVSGKVSIDSTAGTLKAVDGDFSGSVKATSFEIYKNGNRTFYADNDGNLITEGEASFGGTIKAKNLYQGVYISPKNSQTDLLWYCNDYATFGSESFTVKNAGESYINNFTEGKYYTESEILDLSDGYITYPNLSGFTECTGYANVIYVLPYSASNKYEGVCLPRPEDFPGKVIDIHPFYNGGTVKQFDVKCIYSVAPTGYVLPRLAQAAYIDSNGDPSVGGVYNDHITMDCNRPARFVSMYAYSGAGNIWKWYWVKMNFYTLLS